MALSGSVNTNTFVLESGNPGRYYKLSWTANQNIVNNTSTITWKLTAEGYTGYYAERYVYVNIAGQNVFSKTERVYRYGREDENKQVATGTLTLTHNSDGTKAFSVELGAEVYYNLTGNAPNITGSSSFTLDTIPRASTVTCTSVNIGSAPTITITKAVSSFTHTLKYSFGSLSGTIVEKTSASTYTSWTVPTTFYAQIPNAKAGICIITCETYNGSTLVGTKTTPFTATASESLCKPTFNLTLSDANATAYGLTNDRSNKFIKYHSNVTYNTGAASRNSATLVSQKITCGGVSKTTATGTFNNVESATFLLTATDSRGYTSTTTVNKTLINYVHLTSNIDANLSTDGVLRLTLSGNYFNGSFGSQANTLTLQYRHKTSGGSYTSWQPVSASPSGNTYSAVISIGGFDYRNQYTVQARAVDKLENKESVEVSVRSVPVFDWGENDFAFNVPVSIQGASVPSIVDQDTDGDWSYRKWSDGTAECWCTKTFENVSVTNTWGSLFTSGMIPGSNLALPSGLFITMPTVITSLSTTALGGILMAPGGTGGNTTSATYTGALEIARGTGSAGTYIINYHVKGRWK